MNRRQFLQTSIGASLALGMRAAETDRKFRVAIIGHTGRGDYGHGLDKMWLSVPETEIVAVADADAKGLAAAQKKLQVAKGFADYRAMLVETKPDVVAICLRHIDQHRDIALAAIEAGARGIYIEKPFCRTPAEADEIVAACERRGVKFAIAHRNRYDPSLKTIDRLVKEDAIGRLLELRGRGKEDQRGGGLDLWVLGSHVLNLAHYFAGNPLACSAVVLQNGRPITRADVAEGAEGVGPLAGNQVHARFEMERGVPAYFDSIQKAGNSAAGFGLQLIGARGIIDMRIDKHPIAHLLPGSPFEPAKDPRSWISITSAGVGQPEPIAGLATQLSSHLLQARDLIAAIRENRQPACNVYDGRVTVEMITSVFESHRLNGQRVTFPLQTRQNPLAML
ncbi:MAG: Gfo/Idh/MocA family oxidoreductase [Verrucomicrobiota bacterium]|nr:Gfo/Idh/MocA family oxidoreductase [Verrucomicrobiota bacterium]